MIDKVSLFFLVSAIVTSLSHRFVPPNEVFFVTCVSHLSIVCCAAIADPTSFFQTLFSIAPFLQSWMPSILKSMECIQEGEKRVASMMTNKVDSDQKHNGADTNKVSLQMLTAELCKRSQWRLMLGSAVTGLCIKYIAYQKPKVIGQMLDAVVQEKATMDTAFWPFFRPLIVHVLIDYIMVSAHEWCKHGAAHRYNAKARTDMIANLLHQDEEYLQSERYAAGWNHLINVETNRLQKLVNETINRFVFGVLSSVLGISMLLRIDRRLAVLGIIFKSPLLATIQQYTRRDIVKYGMLYEASMGSADRIASNILTPAVMHLLQSQSAQHKAVRWYREKQEEFITYLEYTHFRQTLLCMVHHGLNNIEDVMLLGMAMACVLEGTITVGVYYTFRSHLTQLDQGLKELFGLWNEMITIRMSSMTYFELLYRKSIIQQNDGSVLEKMDKSNMVLSLKNVSFVYRLNPSVKVLDGINLQLTSGKVVALCGSSGGGKSTITRLIQRFYDPTAGCIELNDIDIRTLNTTWLRQQIQVIDQDPILPELTIFDNIALGIDDEDAKSGTKCINDRVIEAAKLADAHDFITNKCEHGYNTPVRSLTRLSGGERQRIAIARALVTHANILICDEITASLDAETEKTIMDTLFHAMKGKVVLMIAHRLSTIRHADEIAFLENGKIVERGTHDQLIKLNGRYSDYLTTLSSSPCSTD